MTSKVKRQVLIQASLFAILLILAVKGASTAYGLTTTSKYTGVTYTQSSALSGYVVADGIDVSVFQGDIDWAKVKADGIDFAFIRAGGRGYSQGTFYSDTRFAANMKGAKANGIMVGVYFFSQAITEKEAEKEVDKTLEYMLQAGYTPDDLDLPIVMDYEMAGSSSVGRLYKVNKTTRTAVAKHWMEYAKSKGFTPAIYTDLNFSATKVNGNSISKLVNYWAAQYYTLNQFPFDYSWWQYSSSGTIDGINGSTDMNFWYINPNNTSTLNTGSTSTLRQMSGFMQTAKAVNGSARYSLADSNVSLTGGTSFTYGKQSKFEPAVEVSLDGNTLKEGTDYKVRYIGNSKAGTAYAIVIGQGDYTDYKMASFKVKAVNDVKNMTFTEIGDQKYTGTEITPSVTVKSKDGTILQKGKDYSITYSDNINVGEATITITFMGNYKGTKDIPFNIVKATQKITIGDARTQTYLSDGSYKLDVKVKFDTTIIYTSSDPEVASVSKSGVVTPLKGGTTTVTIKCATNQNFKSIKRQIELTVIDDIAEDDDPENTETNKSNEANETGENGELNEAGSGEEQNEIGETEYPENGNEVIEAEPVSIKDAVVEGLVSKVWSGRNRTQNPVITLNGETLVKGTDYKLTYKNNKNVGKATMTVTGIGNYTGKKSKTFKIVPKKTTIRSLTPGSKKMTVKWTKMSVKMSESRITGYQVQLAANKTFTSVKKTRKVEGYKSTSYKFTGLKSGKRYYVRIRTYLTIGDKTYYSKWSGYKSSKTK